MATYTRQGDRGKTSLFDGKKVSKSDLRIEVLGTIDELNCALGVVLSLNKILSLNRELIKIQNDLLDIGSFLANPKSKKLNFLTERIKEFENLIDQMTGKLPILHNFILPGGGKTGSMLHLCRAICRRLERKIVALNSKQKLSGNIIIYFNRLSDLLFTMARFANFKEKKKEIVWRKNG